MVSQKILIIGGLGYIGSHVAKRLGSLGQHVCIFDNLSSGCVGRLATIRYFSLNTLKFFRGDIRNQMDLTAAFDQFRPDAVIHLAGQKAVDRSFKNPELFHSINVTGTARVLETASSFGCNKLVFSSSAAVYGDQPILPVCENAALAPISPYGETKVLGERCVRDWASGEPFERSAVILRYFNPCGCDASLLTKEVTSNAGLSLPEKLVLVALKRQRFLEVLGTDHPTPDGSAVRDFLHIEDVADAHVAALQTIENSFFCEAINVGTGKGTSVLQLIRRFEVTSGIKIPVRHKLRTEGDLSDSTADVTKSRCMMKWQAQRTLDEICANLTCSVSAGLKPRLISSSPNARGNEVQLLASELNCLGNVETGI